MKQGLLEICAPDHQTLTPAMKYLLMDLSEEFKHLEKRIAVYDKQLKTIANQTPDCQRLMQLPGIGFITATYLWVILFNPQAFRYDRHFSAYLGLVPRQHRTSIVGHQ